MDYSVLESFLKGYGFHLRDHNDDEKFKDHLSELYLNYKRSKVNDRTILERVAYYCDGIKSEKGLKAKISFNKAMGIVRGWNNNYYDRQLYLFGMTNVELADLEKNGLFKNKNKLIKIIKEDPLKAYQISISRAQSICNIMGREVNSQQEQYGMACRYIWNKASSSRVVSLSKEEFNIYNKISLDVFTYEWGVTELYSRIYLDEILELEIWLATRITEIFKYESDSLIKDSDLIEESCKLLKMSEEQTKGIHLSLSSKISIITGEAGSGKSTMIRALTYIIIQFGKTVSLLAPTGFAVDRIRERLSIFDNGKELRKHIKTIDLFRVTNKQKYDWIIIDESSMMSYDLAIGLLSKIDNETSIIFVGDNNQLSPVGLGNFFDEMIKTKTIPKIVLTENFRSGKNDGALLTARSIVDCTFESFETNFPSLLVREGEIEMVKEVIINCKDKLGIQKENISILSPFIANIEPINNIFSTVYNTGGSIVGKRVMMTRNFNKKDISIMNGEQGIVKEETSQFITVNFKGEEYEFLNRRKKDKLCSADLVISYCRTIHKAQGDESPVIIVYIPKTNNFNFCNKSLIYTALTRYKNLVVLVGDKRTMNIAAKTPRPYDGSQLSSTLYSSRFLG